MAHPIDTGLVSLYHRLSPDEVDLEQLATPDQIGEFAAPPDQTLTKLTDEVDLGDRQGRYAANLAYTLSNRLRFDDDSVDGALHELGVKILSRFEIDDPVAGEAFLREALARLNSADAEITDDIADDLVSAFGGALSAVFNATSGTWNFTGAAAETATMLTELASTKMDCASRAGKVRLGDKLIPVTVIEYELCTQAPFARCAPGVDPRNWKTYNPLFFDKIELLTPAPAQFSPQWTGVIQETVGAFFSGWPVITNLSVSYMAQPGLAVTSYDLAPANLPLKADDGTVTVDYGLFAVMDEGVHRRVRMLKVVHIDNRPMPHKWMCPIWAQHLANVGWWF